MFFPALLLEPQHKRNLSLPWIAATLGVKKIKKEDIVNCNVCKTCDHILIFVKSESLNPKKRFSLRLSAILINGACRILRQQVIFLRGDIDRNLLAREKEADRLLSLLDKELETPPSPKPTVKRKKVKQTEVGTPESLVGRMVPRQEKTTEPEYTLEPLRIPEVAADEAILEARRSDITLREEIAPPKEPQLLDDFGPIEEFPVLAPSASIVQEVVAEVHVPPKSPEKRIEPARPSLEDIEIVPQPEVPQPEDVAGLQRPESEVPQVTVEIVPPPPEEEPAIQVVPEAEVIPAPPTEKEADKGAVRKEGKKDKRASPVQKKKPSDITQLRVVEPEIEPRAPPRKGQKNTAARLLLKTRKRKFVFINQEMQIFRDEAEFIPVAKIIPDFKPMIKFWPDWETMQSEVEPVRPPRDTGSTRISGATEGSLGPGADKSETLEQLSVASTPLAQQIVTPGEVTPSGPTYVSTPRKRPHPGEETVEEVLAPAGNGEMGPPSEMLPPRKRKKVVSIEDVQAAELPIKDIPEDQILISQEPPEIQPLAVPEISEIPPPEERRPVEVRKEPVEKGMSPVGEKTVPEVEETATPPRRDYESEAFGVKWSRIIIEAIYQHEKIRPAELCRAIQKRTTKQNMSIIFATLLTLAKDRYVILRSAEDSCELEFIEKGPKEFEL